MLGIAMAASADAQPVAAKMARILPMHKNPPPLGAICATPRHATTGTVVLPQRLRALMRQRHTRGLRRFELQRQSPKLPLAGCPRHDCDLPVWSVSGIGRRSWAQRPDSLRSHCYKHDGGAE